MALSDSFCLRWGIAGAGKICHDFVHVITGYCNPEEHKVVAVAARSLERAREFADRFDIPEAIEGYGKLSEVQDVDVVYVGTINPTHIEIVEAMLEAGKAVLCEKPLGMNLKETQRMVELARKNKVFLMEGIWSRFIPSYVKVEEILASGIIGDVSVSQSSFGKQIQVDRMLSKAMGGGTTLDLGIYCVLFACLAHGALLGSQSPKVPVKVSAVGHLDESEKTDKAVSAAFIFKDGETATFQTHCDVDLPCEAAIFGTKGSIKLSYPFWSSTRATVTTATGEQVHEFPLPEGNPAKSDLGFNFWNSANFFHEIRHVRQCLEQKLLESPKLPLELTLRIAGLLEDVRKQVGVEYPQDSSLH